MMNTGNLFRLVLLLAVPGSVFCFDLPAHSSKPFDRSAGLHFRVFGPAPESHVERRPPEYEYGAATLELPDEEEYGVFDKYSTIPVYGYYSVSDVPDEKENEAYGIIEDRPPGDDPIDDLKEEMMEEDRRKHDYLSALPETWVEGEFPKYEGKAEEPPAFPGGNPMWTGAVGDAAVDYGYGKLLPFAYAPSPDIVPPAEGRRDGDDEDEERHWYYGVPITEVDESKNAGAEDDSVRELESLREKIRNPKPNVFEDSKTKARGENPRNAETAPATKDKIILQLQKSIDGRKKFLPSEPLEVRKKQIYASADSGTANKLGNFYAGEEKAEREKAPAGKFTKAKGREAKKVIRERPTEIPSIGKAAFPSEVQSKAGQKEFVLPRPANPARTTFSKDIAPRAPQQASLHDAIRKILSMEETLRKREKFQVRKRFVLSEDQLMSELSGLKKMAL